MVIHAKTPLAYILDGRGRGQEIAWRDVERWDPTQGILWVHLDHADPSARDWITTGGLAPIVCEALLAQETRPRSVAETNGLLVTLRGVNLNPGADPEDMVAIRLWIEERRIISVRHRPLLAVQDLRSALAAGQGPESPGEFLVAVADRLVGRMADVIDSVDEAVDRLEEEVISAESHQIRPRLAAVRRQAIALRRYLAPQRDALARLYMEPVPWLDEVDRARLREVADRTTRYVEDLDSARDRAAVTQEELVSRLSEQMDRRMYILSLVAAVFLPLGFATGLLGINVGGIPGADYRWAFTLVSGSLLTLAVGQLWLFWRKHWL